MLYLLNMSVSGIKNIKREIRLDFYKKTVDKDFKPNKYRIKAIYGENGSGKTAIMTSLKIAQDLILANNYLSESQNQKFLSEIINKENKEFKLCLEYITDFKDNFYVYKYEIVLYKNQSDIFEIKKEKLQQKTGNYPNNNYKVIYECEKGELKQIDLGKADQEYVRKKTINLLTHQSFIYLFMFNVDSKEFMEEDNKIKWNFFMNIMIGLIFMISLNIYLEDEDQHELYFLKKRLKENVVDKKNVGENIVDLINDIKNFSNVNERLVEKDNYKKYEEKVTALSKFIKIFKPELISIDIDKKDDGDRYVCELIMNYGTYQVNKEFESTGIKKLIKLFDSFTAASERGIVFIDEMDSNLNDIYLCKLVEFFMYYGKGQLCFTTHNLDPMSVLKDNKNSIDFLSSDNMVVQWASRGNSTPDNLYRNGMIENSPFNVDATDFIGIFGGGE